MEEIHKLEMHIPGKVSEGYFIPKTESFKHRIYTPKDPFRLKSASLEGIWWMSGEITLGTLIQIRTNHIIIKELHIGEKIILEDDIFPAFELKESCGRIGGLSFYLWGESTNPTIQVRFRKVRRSIGYVKDFARKYDNMKLYTKGQL